MSQFASVEDSNPKMAPTLTSGKITPEIFFRWERSCIEYFRVKKIEEEKKVESILSRLQDVRIVDWAVANETLLKTLDFATFTEKFRGQVLEKDWDRKIKLSILASKQGERPFEEWANEIQSRNALLRGRKCHFGEAALRETLENNMDSELETRMMKTLVAEDVSLREWVEAVRVEDELLVKERGRMEEVAKRLYKRDQKMAKTPTFSTFPSNSANSGRTMGNRIENTVSRSTNFTSLPKLTPAERAIIFEHQGCFKCRKLYVEHKGANCPNGFPAPGSYKPLTNEYAEAVRDSKNKPKPRAQGTVAHVGYVTEGEGGPEVQSAVLGIGEEDLDDETRCAPTNSLPFFSRHLEWRCRVDGPSVPEPLSINALIDNGSHSVLIDEKLVRELGLRRRALPSPQRARLAMGEEEVEFTEWVRLRVFSNDQQWTARTVRAIVAPRLAFSVLLGGPFLESNKIVIDHELGQVVAKDVGYQLLPGDKKGTPENGKAISGCDEKDCKDVTENGQKVFQELRERTKTRKAFLDEHSTTKPNYKHFAKALRDRIDILAVWDDLARYEQEVRETFKDRFPADIPHVTRLPDDVFHRFRLKDPEKVIKCRSYACPKKYKDAWKQLLDQHLEAGRIRESSSEYCSPSFLIPKADPTVLPRWVNDYRVLNENTIPDHYPLPRIEGILSDCAKGAIWAKIDMTNSFFQTRVHPDDVKFTAVMTPFGLYEWVVMPMGCKNAPATHQRRMNQALRKHIGAPP